MDNEITPEVVLAYKEATDSFLCSLSANSYKIYFLKYILRDVNRKITLYEVDNGPFKEEEKGDDISDENKFRTTRYSFGPNFF